MAPGNLNLNIEIKDLPASANRVLDLMSALTGKRKWEIVRDALIEYAENHRKDLARLVTKGSV